MARNGPREQAVADAYRSVKAARQAAQRARDDARRAADERERQRLQARRLAGRAGVKGNRRGGG